MTPSKPYNGGFLFGSIHITLEIDANGTHISVDMKSLHVLAISMAVAVNLELLGYR